MRGQSAADTLALLHFLKESPAEYIRGENIRACLRRKDASIFCERDNLEGLAAAGLIRIGNNSVSITETGLAKFRRASAGALPYLAQHRHISLREKTSGGSAQAETVQFDDSESPLAWLAKRKDKSGQPLIDAAQLAAGERMRADFTRAGMTPRVTANWIAPVAQGRRGSGDGVAAFSDTIIAAKDRLTRAIEFVGPEFSGILLDVCCFLKGLEIVERERRWPQRTAKIVLGLALDRLARHYGIGVEARGPVRAAMRAWQAEGARPSMESY